MIIYLTQEVSGNIPDRFEFINELEYGLELFFKGKTYGADLEVLFIGLFCMSPNFEGLFKMRKPKYVLEGKEYTHKGVIVRSKDKSLGYELRLDYEIYHKANDVKTLFAQDILKSLDTINTVKKIKDFDLSRFKVDFESFFKLNGYL